MGLVYHNGRFIPEEHIEKANAQAEVLRILRSFLDANEPGLVRFLVNTFRSQGQAITYKEIREAILSGDIDPQWLDDWMKDYAKLVEKVMRPAWEKAIEAGFTDRAQKFPGFYFNPMADGVRAWASNHAAEFVTNVSTSQMEGLRAVIRRAVSLEDMSVDELARVIRPMIGLTKQQSSAVMNYYQKLREKGVTPKRAREMAIRDAARRHRYDRRTIPGRRRASRSRGAAGCAGRHHPSAERTAGQAQKGGLRWQRKPLRSGLNHGPSGTTVSTSMKCCSATTSSPVIPCAA